MSVATLEYGIEHSISGEAQAYIDERIDATLHPIILTRTSIPAYSARDVVAVTDWEQVR